MAFVADQLTTEVTPATILLVDDDEAVRHFAGNVLSKQGFRIIEAADGSEALEAAADGATQVDLLLTDVIMPKINGLVLAQRLLQQRPGTCVVYMSGYVEQTMLPPRPPESSWLQKPFSAETLTAIVRQALAADQRKVPK